MHVVHVLGLAEVTEPDASRGRDLVEVPASLLGPPDANERGAGRDQAAQVRRVLAEHLAGVREGLVAHGLAASVVEAGAEIATGELVAELWVVGLGADLAFEATGVPVELLVRKHVGAQEGGAGGVGSCWIAGISMIS